MNDLTTRIIRLETRLNKAEEDLIRETTKADIYKNLFDTNVVIRSVEVKQRPIEVKEVKPRSVEVKQRPIEVKEVKPRSVEVKQRPIDVKEVKIVDTGISTRDQTSTILNGLSTSGRTYIRVINKAKSLRTKSMGRFKDVDGYVELCQANRGIITTELTSKNLTPNKINAVVSRSFTPLELRLMQCGRYWETTITGDETAQLQLALKEWQPTYATYSEICQELLNYGSVITNIRDNMTRVFTCDVQGAHSVVVYAPRDDESGSHEFYRRGRDGAWVMDCRLEELTTAIASNLIEYLVSMFRRLYMDIFGDNDYRDDYRGVCQLTECDCEQLLSNLFVCTDEYRFNQIVRGVVETSARYVMGSTDEINMRSDDQFQYKRFPIRDDSFISSITRRLFDKITPDECIIFTSRY